MKHNTLAHLFSILLAICLLFSFTSCSKMENVDTTPTAAVTEAVTDENGNPVETTGEDAASGEYSSPSEESGGNGYDADTEDGTAVLSSNEEVEYYVPSSMKNPGNRTVTLYIWGVDSYKAVTWHYRDSLTVQKLLEGIQHETNWDLSTGDIKYNGQTVTILWSKTCSLYAGVPEQQAKDYLVFDQKDLDAAILDSVKKTIIENLGPSYSVCYGNAQGGDLTLSGIGVTIPVKTPYTWFGNYT